MDFIRHVFAPFGVWRNPSARPPRGGADGLKVVSWNVMVKTTHLEAVARDLRTYGGDVVCLQETSEATARELARRLGMHVAWHEHPLHSYGGNAVLSRWPIVQAREVGLVNPWWRRLREFFARLLDGEPRLAPLDSRHMIHATLRVGDRLVDVLNGHLTLFGRETNAAQRGQIAELARTLHARGRTVVAAGDWNADFARLDDPRLQGFMTDWWEGAATRAVDGPAGERARIGATLAGADKRFDNLFVTRDARVVRAFVDQRTRASDHQPISAEIRFGSASPADA